MNLKLEKQAKNLDYKNFRYFEKKNVNHIIK